MAGWTPVTENTKPVTGWTPVTETSAPHEQQQGGFWDTLGGDLKGMIEGVWEAAKKSAKSEEPQTIQEFFQKDKEQQKALADADAARKAAGYSPVYRALAPGAEQFGMNVAGSEQAARQGNIPAVLGHAAAPVSVIAATEGVKAGAGAIKEALPNAARAGAALGEVKGIAGEVPIDMARPGNTALELYEQSQRGATLPKVVRDFVKRATSPGDEPITYAEAKDFQSNVSALSADERMKLKPNTKRLLGQLNADLKDSLESAADVKGKGEQFTDAMKEYHHAMQLHNLTEEAKSALWKAALTGVGLYGAKKILESVAP